jgi:hypothetical protein
MARRPIGRRQRNSIVPTGTDVLKNANPALKCWATFFRSLRDEFFFPGKAARIVMLTLMRGRGTALSAWSKPFQKGYCDRQTFVDIPREVLPQFLERTNPL